MRSRSPRPTVLHLLVATAALAVGGCGQDLLAPDDLGGGSRFEAFLDRIDKHCGRHHLGIQTVSYLLNFSQDDAYFIDVTSKLYSETIDRATYTDDINGNYPAGANQPAIDCIFTQLGDG